MTKPGFGYVRVSTPKQGEGVSLEVQQDAITASAKQNGYHIVEWFIEKKTAAKRGRPKFNEMMARLKKKEALGVFIHKIDRGARNLHDWTNVTDFADAGVDVFFTHESINLRSRGGRLAANMQAVVADDYIRNLKEEAKKGQEGRIKQGLYPWHAPIGYRDNGKAKVKTIDPVSGPLVRLAFELYATGTYTLDTLAAEMRKRGLRNRRGNPVHVNTLSWIFRNPFYAGIIYVRKWRESFQGKHEPLISRALFDRVQDVLRGKIKSRGWRHQFLYRRTFRCAACRHSILSERQKGHVYYRCHTRACRGTSLREETITEQLRRELGLVQMSSEQREALREHIENRVKRADAEQEKTLEGIRLQLAQLAEREEKMTDALIDGLIPKEAFSARNARLLEDRQRLEDRRRALEGDKDEIAHRLMKKLELAESLSLSGEETKPEEIVDVVKNTNSNLSVNRKDVVVDWVAWVRALKKPKDMLFSPLNRGTPRTNTTAEWCVAVVDAMLHDASDNNPQRIS
jgi:DNA invertase Pin-like site-specific DNA recombinase